MAAIRWQPDFPLAGEGDLNELRKRLNENSTLTEEDFREVVHIDVPMPLSYADNHFVKELSLLEPFGAGNPKPVFAQKNVRLLSGKILGKNRNVGKFRIADESGSGYDMIYFGDMEKLDRFLSERTESMKRRRCTVTAGALKGLRSVWSIIRRSTGIWDGKVSRSSCSITVREGNV